MMEMSLFGSVASGKLESVLDALERSCGPPSDWSLLETTFSLEKTDAKVRWTPGQSSMQIVQVTPPVRVTTRPEAGQLRALEQVICRPHSVVSEATPEHLKVLMQSGFVKKYATFQRGHRFVWGKAVVTVCQLFAPAPTAASAADFTKRLISPEWLVSATIYSGSADCEDAAAVLVGIKNLLSGRVDLHKML